MKIVVVIDWYLPQIRMEQLKFRLRPLLNSAATAADGPSLDQHNSKVRFSGRMFSSSVLSLWERWREKREKHLICRWKRLASRGSPWASVSLSLLGCMTQWVGKQLQRPPSGSYLIKSGIKNGQNNVIRFVDIQMNFFLRYKSFKSRFKVLFFLKNKNKL